MKWYHVRPLEVLGTSGLGAVAMFIALGNYITQPAQVDEDLSRNNLRDLRKVLAERILDSNKDGYTSIEEWKPAYKPENWRKLDPFNPKRPTNFEIELFLANYSASRK
jgi:hypothetical protein